MIVKPTVKEMLKNVNSRFGLVIAVSKRARQIADENKSASNEGKESPVTIAANEVAEGKVKTC